MRLISGCLGWHHAHHDAASGPVKDPPPLDDRSAKQLLGTVNFFLRQYYYHSSNPNANGTSFQDSSSLKSSSQTQPLPQRTSESLNNQFISSVISPLQSGTGKFIQDFETPASTASPSTSFTKRFRRTSIPTPVSLAENHQASSPLFAPLLKDLESNIERRKLGLFSDSVERKTALDILKDCLISCSVIVSYISASRWDVMQTRLRTKLSNQWSAASANASPNASTNGTHGQPTASQEDVLPDMTEIHLFEFSNYNDARLSSLLGELSSSFTSLRRSVQTVISLMLHDILDSYTSANHRIFYSMYEDGKRLTFAGQPEALFDALFSVGDNLKRRSATWPTLASLLPLCPEIVMQIAMGGGDTRSPMLSKKVLFLDALRKAVRSIPPTSSSANKGDQSQFTFSQEARLALQCYTVMCKAASYAIPIKGRPLPPLWILADEMQAEIKKRLLDPIRPCLTQEGSIDMVLVESAVTSVGRMSPNSMKDDILPRLLSAQAHVAMQVATLNTLPDLLRQEDIDVAGLKDAVRVPALKLLHQAVTSTFGTDTTGRPSLHNLSQQSKQIMDDGESERNQLVLAILRLFRSEPDLLLRTEHDNIEPSTVRHKPVPFAEALLTVRPHDQSQAFALLACLMQEDNHKYIQDTVVDLLLFLQQQVEPFVHEVDNSTSNIAQKRQGLYAFYANIDTVALALARPCLAPPDETESGKVALRAFTRFLQEFGNRPASSETTASLSKLTVYLAEMIGLLQLCSANSELKGLGMGIVQAAASIIVEKDDSKGMSNIDGIAAAIEQEAGPVVGGQVAQMKRLMKIFRSITHYTPGLAAAWAELYAQWNNYGDVFGMQGFENQADKSVGGIEMSFMQVVTPNEVSSILCQNTS